MRANGIAFFEVASTVSTARPLLSQNLFASLYSWALTDEPLTNTPPALVFVSMYVSGPVGITPLEAHAASSDVSVWRSHSDSRFGGYGDSP